MGRGNEADVRLIERIVEYADMSVSAIATKAGLSPSTLLRVAKGEAGWRLKPATLDALRLAFPKVFESEEEGELSRYLQVEVLPSFAGMGGGGTGEGDSEVALVPRRLIEERLRAQAGDLLMIEVRGDSMRPDFEHGDQILVDRRDCNPTQPGPFALFDGDAYVVKLVEKLQSKKGWLRVFSVNDRYSPYEVPEGELKIIGRPVWYARCL